MKNNHTHTKRDPTKMGKGNNNNNNNSGNRNGKRNNGNGKSQRNNNSNGNNNNNRNNRNNNNGNKNNRNDQNRSRNNSNNKNRNNNNNVRAIILQLFAELLCVFLLNITHHHLELFQILSLILCFHFILQDRRVDKQGFKNKNEKRQHNSKEELDKKLDAFLCRDPSTKEKRNIQ